MTALPAVKPRVRRKPAGRFHHGDLAEQIAVAAADLVERKGHHALSMRELATRLGVTEPALYRHYPGRDGILAEVALRGLARFIATIEGAVARANDPFEAVLAFGQAYVRFAAENPGWFRLQFSRAWTEQVGRLPGVRARMEAGEAERQRFLARLTRALPAGDRRAADLYRLVWGTAHGLATLVVERVFQLVRTDEERIAAADEALRLLVQSLRARAQGPADAP